MLSTLARMTYDLGTNPRRVLCRSYRMNEATEVIVHRGVPEFPGAALSTSGTRRGESRTAGAESFSHGLRS